MEGLGGEQLYRTIFYVLDWSCFRVLCLGERFVIRIFTALATLYVNWWHLRKNPFLDSKLMFTLPSPQHLLSFPTLPQSPPGENLWRSVFKNVLLQQYYLDHNKSLIFVLSLYLTGWHTGCWLVWTNYSKDDECRGKRYTPVFCWVSHIVKDCLLKP